MEIGIRFEVHDGEWVSSKSVEQSLPQRIPSSIQLLAFEESLAQSDDFLLHSLDASSTPFLSFYWIFCFLEVSSVRSRILATPAYSKKKKETSFEEIWSALLRPQRNQKTNLSQYRSPYQNMNLSQQPRSLQKRHLSWSPKIHFEEAMFQRVLLFLRQLKARQ